MRTITIRQLSINLFKELEDLPVAVTRYGKDFCIITSDSLGRASNKLSKTIANDPTVKITGPLSQESQNTPKPVVTVSDPRQKAVKEGSDKQDALIREVLVNGTAEPVVFETPKARAISKFKKRIPLSKEMEEKILNPGEKTVSRPRGELDIDNYV